MTGLIFDIQRSSFCDGDGARTTVFFKGCNLKCKWCHNPEGIGRGRQILFYESRCISCGKCVEACLNKGKACTLCGSCAILCPQNAKEICGQEYDCDELMELIERDRDLYEATGGGVTFSGGECMLQIDFLEEILRQCHQKGINTAVDTAGNVPFSYFERILPYTSTFLYDIKCINENLHKEYTGVTNRLILENFEKLCRVGARIVVRVPIIGGVNDGDEEFSAIFEYLKGRGLEKVEALRYHNMGAHKCEGAGVPFYHFEAPSVSVFNEIMERLKGV